MNLRLESRSSPLRLLLGLEWVLFGVAAISQIVTLSVNPNVDPWFDILGIAAFGAMRWFFPQRWIAKLLYTVAEFLLLLLLNFASGIPAPLLLYVVLTIRNCILFAGQNDVRNRVRAVFTGLAFAIGLLSLSNRMWAFKPIIQVAPAQIGTIWVGFAIVFGLVFLFLHLLVDAVLAEQRGQEQLAAANQQLRQYAVRVEELATVQERNRIARDIHDSLGHSLTVFNIHVAAALRLLHADPVEAEALLQEVKQLGTQALEDVRESVAVLRTDPLQGRSIEDAIARLITEFERATGIVPSYKLELVGVASRNENRPLSSELKLTLYRLIQESLTNISKHAAATEVAIVLQTGYANGDRQSAATIQAIVQDNGKGFDLDRQPAGFGLQGMQERTLALAGELTIKTAPGHGCHIQAIFPLSVL
jgi:signal transduction histidine kinase